ncbi:MAG: methionyl-tRNA formyltransferase, partial [Pseudomonadota bacterium]
VYNLIRGCNPQPGAWTTIGGAEVQVYDARPATAEGHAPGDVVSVAEEGVLVQAGEGGILIKRVRPAGGGKIPAADWATETALAAGSRLGT